MTFLNQQLENETLIGQYRCILKDIMNKLKKKRIKIKGLNFTELL